MEQRCYLNEDFLLKEIVPKLPTKSILRFKSVSRSWLARCTTDPTFTADHALSTAAAHHDLCSIDHRLFVTAGSSAKLVELDTTYIRDSLPKPLLHFELVGSGNGLVCLQAFFSDCTCELVIWNPVSREFKRVPPLGLDPEEAYYFGVPKGSDDYTLVCLWNACTDFENLSKIGRVTVLSRGESSWKPQEYCVLPFEFWLIDASGQGLTLDGILYWAALYDSEHPSYETDPFHIWSYDLGAKRILQIRGLPMCRQTKVVGLFENKGRLTVALSENNRRWQIFTMESNTNNTYSWTSILVDTSRFLPYEGVGFLGNQLILSSPKSSRCWLYDFTTDELTTEVDGDDGIKWYTRFKTSFAHIHTLVSPN